MEIVKIALVAVCGVIALVAFVKPLTKEKFFFLAITLLLAWSVFDSPDQTPEQIDDEMKKARASAIAAATPRGQKDFVPFYTQIVSDAGTPTSGRAFELARVPAPDIKTLGATNYGGDPENKPLFRRRVEVQSLGRVHLSAPRTPGIEVLTGHSSLGPEIQSQPTRDPLGLLDAPTWQAWVTIGVLRAEAGDLAAARTAFQRALELSTPDKRAEIDAHRRRALGE